jgi:hypothetical protein
MARRFCPPPSIPFCRRHEGNPRSRRALVIRPAPAVTGTLTGDRRFVTAAWIMMMEL